MLLNFILLLSIILAITLLSKFKKTYTDDKLLIPSCKFVITEPLYEIDLPIRIAKFKVYSKYKDRYFRDFPIGFKFYSDSYFKTKIKINYTISGNNEIETIYDLDVEFNENHKIYNYYINDIIMGSIDIEIITNSEYGKPTIEFEILQGSTCHVEKPNKIEIKFLE